MNGLHDSTPASELRVLRLAAAGWDLHLPDLAHPLVVISDVLRALDALGSKAMKNQADNPITDNETPAQFLTEASALEEGLRLGGAGVWRWRIDSNQLRWTRNLESVHQLPPGSFDGTLSSFQRDLHPEDAASVWQAIARSIETGDPYKAVYRTAPRENEPDLWIETSGGIVIASDGSRYLTGVCVDATERVRNKQALERRLAQQNAVARFGSYALNEGDFEKVLSAAVQIAADVLRVPLTKILQFADSADHLLLRAGMGWGDGLVGHAKVGIERASQAGYTLLAKEPVIVRDLLEETRFSGPKLLHDHKARSGISVVIPGSEFRPFGVFGIHAREVRQFDETDAEFLQSLANIVAAAARQAGAADHQRLLVREMAHRAGNMLQLVNSIAGQTFTAEASIEFAKETFSKRLSALASANYIVSRGGWRSTRFQELVEEALKPFGARVASEGRDILLPPELCFDMGLVLHEFATNSVKYGTLGKDYGAIRVNWSFRPRSDGSKVFRFEWDDPLSTSAGSANKGFGSKLVHALIERKWSGVVAIIHDPHFRTTLEVPLRSRAGGDD
ncbi:MAG TPA: HWE histidine kinase domain-containing protein [Bauldia sp.]|nr:HWE histidine kinase domain-containing protein [Bauldia sp.]